MTQEELSIEFTRQYDSLRTYASKMMNKFPKDVALDVILSECYLHLSDKADSLDTPNKLAAYAKKFIKSNYFWYNSVIFKETQTHKKMTSVDITTLKQSSGQYLLDTDLISEKMDEFYNGLSTYDKGLFLLFFREKKQTAKLIGEHYGISTSSGYIILRQCKELEKRLEDSIKQYMETYT